MIKIDRKLYPVFMKENVTYLLDDNDDKRYVIPKRHSELDKLVINKEGKYILDFCNGENNLDNVISLMKKEFPQVDEKRLFNDINNFIFSCWKLAIIKWKDNPNPYKQLYNKKINDYVCTILNENEVVKIFKDKENYNFFDRINLINSYVYNIKNLRESCFFYIDQYCTIKKNDKVVAVFSLSSKRKQQLSVDLHIFYMNNSCFDDVEVINELIQWAAKTYSKFANIKFTRINSVSIKDFNDGGYEQILKKLNLEYTGILKNHIYDEENDTFVSLKLYSKSI